MKTIGNLVGNEAINAAAVLGLSATLVALVAKGNGSTSLKGIVSAILSNPVPEPEPPSVHSADVSLEAARMKIAA